jgi:D-serine dehydratase
MRHSTLNPICCHALREQGVSLNKTDWKTPARPRIASLNKGIGNPARLTPAAPGMGAGWNLLREDVSLPAAVLDNEALEHNLQWMQQFISAYGLNLAPHGKTTMAPQLFLRQLQHGAWGITVATAQQALVACEHGMQRVLMANQLIGKENMAIVSRLLTTPGFEFFCLVDSAAQLEQLGAFFRASGQRLQVLIELGVAGGRAGLRGQAQLVALLHALDHWNDAIALCGIEVYEGVLDREDRVRDLLDAAVAITRTLAAEKRFARHPPLLTGAGSAWYDVVAAVFSAAGFNRDVEIVLRPGCYLTHDVGIYREAQARILERNPIARQMQSGLRPALRIWAYVQSVPESERAIVAMGKRDAAFDAGLPVPALHFRPGDLLPRLAPAEWVVTRMMDQHAYLRISSGDDLRVGDMLAFDISHPCLTFDKWRALLVVNAQYDVIDVLPTYF